MMKSPRLPLYLTMATFFSRLSAVHLGISHHVLHTGGSPTC